MPKAELVAPIELTTGDESAGVRLDKFVAGHCPDLSRARVQELVEAGLIRVNGREIKASAKLRAGDRVTVEPLPRPALQAAPEAIPLDVLYEDDDVIAINKPAGMTVHAGAGNSSGTLVNALLGRGQALSQGGDALRPGIVHRLDKDTSGVILIAKNDAAHAKLSDDFRERTVKKTYIALVQGKLEGSPGRIELAIGRDPKHRMRMTARKSVKAGKSRPARTDWRALATFANCTLVEIQLHTGRTHQIRVHFSAIKHPVVGDTLYGAADQLRLAKVASPAPSRQFLHAARLVFVQPRTGATIEVRAPLAPELAEFARKLAAAGAPADSAKIDAALAPFL